MRGSLIGGLAIVTLLAGTGPVSAQIPDEFENLQVLSEDIGKRELVSIMREFSERSASGAVTAPWRVPQARWKGWISLPTSWSTRRSLVR